MMTRCLGDERGRVHVLEPKKVVKMTRECEGLGFE